MRKPFPVWVICAVFFLLPACLSPQCAFAFDAESPARGATPKENAATGVAPQAEEKKEKKGYRLEYELDPYYTNAGIIINLTDKPVPDVGEKPEFEIYKDLLFSSYVPRYLIVEAAVFPMPVAGVAVKSNASGVYRGARISDNFNLVKAVTAGFEEPYALSFFMGDVVSFTSPGEKHRSGNFGYMGYLVSIGNYHIKDNELVKDTSVEIEWKIKGDRKFSSDILNWSFRVGEKLHSNHDITDVVYIALRRSLLDFNAVPGHFLENSGFEYVFDMDNRTFKPVRHYFTVDKKWPYKEKKVGFSMAVGFIWEGASKYTGTLADRENRDNFQVVLRPNFQF